MSKFNVVHYEEMTLGDYERRLRLDGEKRYLERIAYKPFNRSAREARQALSSVKAELRSIDARYRSQ